MHQRPVVEFGRGVIAIAVVLLGCHSAPARTLPHVPEGRDEAPTEIVVVYPEPGHARAHELSASRREWSGLATEALSLRLPREYPQPTIPPSYRSAGDRALADWTDPLAGVTAVTHGDPSPRARTLVVVEMLPGDVIQQLHGSDAFTESYYELDTYGIRRAVVRLPLWLLEDSPDDFANFLQHEFGHALGMVGHLEEGMNLGDRTWFWDRLMTVPTPIGQPWQPVTSEDIAALASGRYRLRDGWIEGRAPRYPHAIPYRSEPIRVAAR